MATKSRGTVQAVIPKQRKDGTPAYTIIIDGVEYWDSKGAFKDSQGLELDFEWEASKDGKFKFINVPGSRPSGGFSRGKSEAEIIQQRKSFALAYAKDLACAILTSNPPAPDDLGPYLNRVSLLRETAEKLTLATAQAFDKFLE